MRPRLLELTAFGPYAESIRVDFDALAEEGLFLIHGPTGAGKSSLLDGLTYALYGGVPGTRRPDRLRSDHADPRVSTAVALEFSLHGHDYRITRMPPHERAKKSGTGMTQQKAKATLSRRDGDAWLPLADGVEEVGTQIVALLGLNREQFQQVVVLPQGDFARALQADANERRRLLSSLFHTHRFAEYTERLLERARLAEDALTASTAALERLAAASAERWQVIATHPENVETSLTPGADPARPPTLAAGAVAVVDQARAALQDAKAAERAASDDLARATLAAHRRQRVAAARTTLAQLDATAAETEAARETLAAAQRAAPCIPLLEDADAAAAQLERLDRRRGACAGALRDLPAQLPSEVTQAVEEALGVLDADDGDAAADRLGASRNVLRSTLSRLQAACAQHSQWRETQAEAGRQQELADEKLAQSAAAATAASAAAEQTTVLGAQRDAALQARERLGPLRDEQAALETAAAAVGRLPDLRTTAADAGAGVRRTKTALNDALDAQRQLLELRIANMAAELAGKLQPGEPCGVCGSREHPAPAMGAAAPVTADDLVAAEAAVGAARAALATAEDLQQRAADDVSAAVLVAGLFADAPEALPARIKEVSTAVTADTVLADQLADIERDVTARTADTAASAAAATRLSAEGRAAADAAATAAAAADRLARTLAATFGTLDDPIPLIGAVEAIAAALESLWTAAVEHDGAAKTARTARRRLRDALNEQGFPDPEAVLAASRQAGEQTRLEELITAADQQRATAEAVLSEEADGTLDQAAETANLAQAQTAKQEADQLLAAAQSRLAVVRQAADDLAALSSRWETTVGDHRALAGEADRLRRLADICNGPGNAQRMSLERYVLAAHLEEIADAASVRLAAISDGRYTVRHSDERVRGGGASGLSITILDAFTGTERDAGTLSGGETFQASLCLALAVAEVVQRHAGGVHLDTLFVDEGFGALDADALEQAMTELDALRAGGRLVGVISHVPVLRERICNAIEVRKTSSGSEVRVVGAGDVTARCA